MKYYVCRIVNNKAKLTCFCFFIFAMLYDLFERVRYIPVGGDAYVPGLNTFLAYTGSGFNFHALIFWLLPLWLMIIVSDDVIEDYIYGYKSVLISKKGKSRYAIDTLKKGFIFSFFVMFIPLIYNMLLSYVLFDGAQRTLGVNIADYTWLKICMEHHILANFGYVFITSLLSGIVGCAGSGLAMAFHDRKIVYPISFALWFVVFIPDKSIMLAIQPFSEYGPSDALFVYLLAVIIHTTVAVFAYMKEIKYAKI